MPKGGDKAAAEKAVDKSKKQLRYRQPSESESEPGGVMEVDASVFESINARLSKLDMLDALQQDLRELRTSLEYSQKQIDDLSKENAFLKGEVEKAQQSAASITLDNKKMNETLLDMQCRSMRDNLIFSGIEEGNGTDTPEETVRHFMTNNLKMSPEVVRDITFSRVHRLGRPVDGKTRPIIARFEHYKQRELVKSRGNKLKGSSLWINEQFPEEINKRRKILRPIMKAQWDLDQKAVMSVDRLYINGQLYRDSKVTPWLF